MLNDPSNELKISYVYDVEGHLADTVDQWATPTSVIYNIRGQRRPGYNRS